MVVAFFERAWDEPRADEPRVVLRVRGPPRDDARLPVLFVREVDLADVRPPALLRVDLDVRVAARAREVPFLVEVFRDEVARDAVLRPPVRFVVLRFAVVRLAVFRLAVVRLAVFRLAERAPLPPDSASMISSLRIRDAPAMLALLARRRSSATVRSWRSRATCLPPPSRLCIRYPALVRTDREWRAPRDLSIGRPPPLSRSR